MLKTRKNLRHLLTMSLKSQSVMKKTRPPQEKRKTKLILNF